MKFTTSSASETERLAQQLSLFAKAGMAILLRGELGTGKSTFARAFIKALAVSNKDFDVPSPTFSLIQSYSETRVPVAHVDLYRLGQNPDTQELGLDELVLSHLLLVEWPSAAVVSLSANTLTLDFSGTRQSRVINAVATGAWSQALARNAEILTFLNSHKIDSTTRVFFEGDASFRRYEKLQSAGGQFILMDMPQRPDGPPVKNGKPYSAIAHLAENIRSVVAVNDQLCHMGYGAPEIHAVDMKLGLALIEDFGPNVFGTMFKSGADMESPMRAAVELLADFASKPWPTSVTLRDGSVHTIPSYDQEAQLIEVDLLPCWFHLHVHERPAREAISENFQNLWKSVLPLAVPTELVWVLRDYHSPNLIWRPKLDALKRVGLIDTQDALLGHPAYDLASLLQDARVDVTFDFADELYAHYVALRHVQGQFDRQEFARAYAILGAQRATKILGIFARLNARDGKPQYLQHMPRVSRYLARNLAHPALTEIKSWYEREMPAALEIGKTQ
ncbi:MAG: tRNA (adenosine(37)-N6)-threonylcarbamoyltransferase complex ATPase subunit type 1 TsaE [Aestuariivirga sp.]